MTTLSHDYYVTFIIICIIVAFILFTLFVQFLWNKLMPEIFNVKTITFLQTVGLMILIHMLFGCSQYINTNLITIETPKK